jgi:uncharacterized protein
MSKEFLGIGWNFPVEVDENGQVLLVAHEASIRQAIEIILGTAKGERMMRPDFGCGIYDLVFAVNSATTVGRINSEVRLALLRWEPRIEVLDVTTIADPQQPNRLLIKIDYRVRTTNNRFNFVHPFYLE